MKGKTKILLVVIAVLTLIFSMNIVNAAEATKEANGWKYTASSEMVRIVGVTDKAVTKLTVPEKMEGVQGPLVNLSAFEGVTNLKEIRFEGKFDAKDGNSTIWITTVDQPELSETTRTYLAKNVTVYGYSYEEVEDRTDNAMLSPKGFASRYGMKFVDLAKEDTTKTEMTVSDVIELIPHNLKIDLKESEFLDADGNFEFVNVATNKLHTILKEKGVDFSKIEVSGTMADFESIHTLGVMVNEKGKQSEYIQIALEYSNSSNYNQNDETMILDYVKKLNLEDKTSTFETGNSQSLYPLTIEARAKKIEQELGVKVIISTLKGDQEEDRYYSSGYIYLAKNDVVYAVKEYYILVEGKEGVAKTSQIANNVLVDTTASNTAVITATEIGDSHNYYAEMVQKAAQKGYELVFKAYEFKLQSGDMTNGINIIFELGIENNGKQAIVLHRKADGTYEEFEKKIENGTIEITVNELSPFLVAIKEVEENSTRELDSEPKTGEENYVMITSIMAVISFVGMIVMKKQESK